MIHRLTPDTGLTGNKKAHGFRQGTEVVLCQPLGRTQHFGIKPGTDSQNSYHFFYIFQSKIRVLLLQQSRRFLPGKGPHHETFHLLRSERHHQPPALFHLLQAFRKSVYKLPEEILYRQVNSNQHILHNRSSFPMIGTISVINDNSRLHIVHEYMKMNSLPPVVRRKSFHRHAPGQQFLSPKNRCHTVKHMLAGTSDIICHPVFKRQHPHYVKMPRTRNQIQLVGILPCQLEGQQMTAIVQIFFIYLVILAETPAGRPDHADRLPGPGG